MNKYDGQSNEQLATERERLIHEDWSMYHSPEYQQDWNGEMRKKMNYNLREAHMIQKEMERRKRRGEALSYWKQNYSTGR